MINLKLKGKWFGDDHVLGALELKLVKSETVAILGPSGMGKSTLLRIIAGLDTEYIGELDNEFRRAMVFQEPTLLPWRTALDNITLIAGVGEDVAENALAELGLAGKANHFPAQLSLGQQRRLALARALAANPDLLIMDEPFASLDEDRAREMWALTRDLANSRRMAILLVTHSREEAEFLASRTLTLSGEPAVLD